MKNRRLDIDRPSPVESRRDEKGGVIIDVVIPILQSFAVGILAAAVIIALINLIYDAGELPFWIGSGTIAASSFLYIIIVQYNSGVCLLDLVTAFLMAVLAGFFCWAFARVATWVRGTWLSMWTFSAFIFLLVFFLHLWLSLIQRLAQPWQFQRKAIWETVKELGVFWGKKEPAERPRPTPREVVITKLDESTQSRTYRTPPVDDATFTAVCRVLMDKTFTESNLCGNGNPLPGGANGRKIKNELRDWMIEEGYLQWNAVSADTGEGIPGQGVSLTEMGQELVLSAVA